MQASFWHEKSVFVTGATGLLGGWIVKELVPQGANVVALIRDGSPRSMLAGEGWLERILTVQGSLQDFALLRRTLCEYSVDTVFHLAAQPLVGVAKMDPLGTLEANVRGTWNVLEAARQCSVGRVIVASSDKAYGPNERLPYRETHPLQGRYPYDASKSCADLISRMYAATYQLPVAVARCANLFGGGDLNFSRMIPDLIRCTLRGQRFVIRSDGQFVRDFLYAKDAALAYLTLAEHLAGDSALAGEAFNFSLEVRLTVLELVHQVLEMMHRSDLQPIVENSASAEIREQYLVAEKAHQVLGWTPRYSLRDGLQETIQWYETFLQKEVSAGRVSEAAAV